MGQLQLCGQELRLRALLRSGPAEQDQVEADRGRRRGRRLDREQLAELLPGKETPPADRDTVQGRNEAISHLSDGAVARYDDEFPLRGVALQQGSGRPVYEGGGFSVSNLGMYGIKSFTSIINPPQSCIIAVGAGEERPVVRDGKVEISIVMTVTMSADHRVVDGGTGAKFLATLKQFIEEPASMLL